MGNLFLYPLQVGSDIRAHLSRDVVQAMAHHMDDAKLDGGMGIDSLDGFRKSFEAVNAGNKDVLHPTVLQFCDDLQPELGTL